MTPVAATITQTTMPLSALIRISAANPRRAAVQREPDEEIEQLAASIAVEGVIQPPIVRKVPDSLQHSEVLAGGRRWRALKLLEERGTIGADYAVPVMEFRHPDPASDAATAEAEAIALAENVVRAPMHPVDEMEAFARLENAGMAADAIAAAFGISVRIVRQRLALGSLVQGAREKWRAGEIGLEEARALATGTPAQQEEALIAGDQVWRNARAIRALVREDMVEADDPLVRYVTLEAYTAAGGEVHADLFDDAQWCTDGALLRKLAEEKLTEYASELCQQEGWGFAHVALQGMHCPDNLLESGREPQYTDEENERLDVLESDDVWRGGHGVEDRPDLRAEANAIEARAYARAIPADERQAMGILVSLHASHGVPYVERAMVWEQEEAEDEEQEASGRSTSTPSIPSGSPAPQGETPPKPKANEVKLAREARRVQLEGLAAMCRIRPNVALALACAAFCKPYASVLTLCPMDATSGAPPEIQELAAASDVAGLLEAARHIELNDLTTTFCHLVADMLDADMKDSDIAALLAFAADKGAIESHLAEAFDAHEWFRLADKSAAIEAITEIAGEEAANRARKMSRAKAAEQAIIAITNRPATEPPWLPDQIRPREATASKDERSTAQAMADAIAADDEPSDDGLVDDELADNDSAGNDSAGEPDADETDAILQRQIGAFLEARTHAVPGKEIKSADLRKAFCASSWCPDRKPSAGHFGKAMRALDIDAMRRSSGWHYVGLQLLDAQADIEDKPAAA